MRVPSMDVYLDHNATTPVDAAVLEAMLPYLGERFGNPSSRHGFGRRARQAVEQAREQVGALVGAHPSQVFFTSGGTEANNLALKGTAARLEGRVILRSAVEHPSVIEPLKSMQEQGWEVREIGVDGQGRVTPGALDAALNGTQACLVSVMYANNETGVINDVAALGDMVRRHDSVMHTDAVQAAGKLPLDFAASGAQLMTLSAHKIYGPKGCGALVMDKSLELMAQIQGGGQERGRRAGTENVAAIVGFGVAAELAAARLDEEPRRLQALRDRLQQGLLELPGAVVFAASAERLPNTLFFGMEGIDGEMLLMQLDQMGLAVASGSACSSGKTDPSHVLLAMGVEPMLARSAIRVSLGRDNGQADIERLIGAVKQITGRLRPGQSRQAAG